MKKSQLIEIIKEEIKDLLRENSQALVFNPLITEIKRILGNPSESLVKVHFFKGQSKEYISIDFLKGGKKYMSSLPKPTAAVRKQLIDAIRNDTTAPFLNRSAPSRCTPVGQVIICHGN